MIQVTVKTRTSLKRKRNDNHYSTKSIRSKGVSDKHTKNLPVMVRDYQPRSSLRSPEVGMYILRQITIPQTTTGTEIKSNFISKNQLRKTSWQGLTLLQIYCIMQQNNFNKIHKRQNLRTKNVCPNITKCHA
jgi:hypothetical protein